MATTDRNGFDDGATIVETQRTIGLTPEQARYVADVLLTEVECDISDVGNLDLREPHQLDAIREMLDMWEAALAQIAWGTPAQGVTLTLPARQLWMIANQLMYEAAEGASGWDNDDIEGDARAKRERLRKAEGGIAIVDQLEAPR